MDINSVEMPATTQSPKSPLRHASSTENHAASATMVDRQHCSPEASPSRFKQTSSLPLLQNGSSLSPHATKTNATTDSPKISSSKSPTASGGSSETEEDPAQNEKNQIETAKSTLSGGLPLPKGSGATLGSIAYVEYRLKSYKGTDNLLRSLHRMLFPKHPLNKLYVKANIRRFAGFPASDTAYSTSIKDRLAKLMNSDLKELCAIMGLFVSGSKDELVSRVHDFLQCPSELPSHVKAEKKKAKAKTSAKKKQPPSKTRDSATATKKAGKAKSKKEEEAEEKSGSGSNPSDSEGESDSDDDEHGSSDDDFDPKSKSTKSGRKRRRETKVQPATFVKIPKKKAGAEESMLSPEFVVDDKSSDRDADENNESESTETVDEQQQHPTPPPYQTPPAFEDGDGQGSEFPSDSDLRGQLKAILREADLETITKKQLTKLLEEQIRSTAGRVESPQFDQWWSGKVDDVKQWIVEDIQELL